MRILFLTSWFGLQEKVYETGFKKLLGERNVDFKVIWGNKLTDYDVVFIGRDILEDRFQYTKLNFYLKKLASEIIFAVTDMADDLLVHRIIYDKRITAYFKREIWIDFLNNIAFRKYLINLISHKKLCYNYLTYPEIINMIKAKKLFPLLFSYIENNEFRPELEKKYLVSFIANLPPANSFFHKFYYASDAWKIKREIALLCKRYNPSFVYLGVSKPGGGIPYIQYLKIISKSISAIATRTVGFDTLRFWEIPYAGTALIAEKTPILIPNYFIEGRHAFFFKNIRELKEILETIKNEKEKFIEIGMKARDFVIKYHSPEKRAEYVLKIINQLNRIKKC
jgi:hypothetical protein